MNVPAKPVKKPKDIYKLVGVVVHSGRSQKGHYYCFALDRM